MASSFITVDGVRYQGDASKTMNMYLAIRGVIDAEVIEQLVFEGTTSQGKATRTVILVTPHTTVHQTIVDDPFDQYATEIIEGLEDNVSELRDQYRDTGSDLVEE